MSKVVTLGNAAPEKALEGLNRLTGLVFESWPESLVDPRSRQQSTATAAASDAIQPVRRAAAGNQ